MFRCLLLLLCCAATVTHPQTLTGKVDGLKDLRIETTCDNELTLTDGTITRQYLFDLR